MSDTFTLDIALKFVGRVGFCLLLVALHRLYLLFSSPLTRAEHKKPMFLFGGSVLLSFILLAINFVIPDVWLTFVVMGFNIVVTYAFAIYLYKQGNKLQKFKTSDEYLMYNRAMDALILKMKH